MIHSYGYIIKVSIIITKTMISINDILYIRLLAIIIPVIALTIGLYFLILLPQKQQLQAHLLAEKQLQIGAYVTTYHGLSGHIHSLSHNFIIIELNDGRKIETITKAIATVCHEKH